jgi:hypothetical protein
MRITERQLRRIIREELLAEASMTPLEARHHDIRFEMRKWRDKVKIVALQGEEEIGWIAADLIPHEYMRVWEVTQSSVEKRGLGPLLYDLAMDAVAPDSLASDRHTVSYSARQVWDYYLNNRGDVRHLQLDDPYNTLTPTDRDNYQQRSALRWGGELEDSSLSKAYMKRSGGTPTLDTLQGMGIIDVIYHPRRP